MAIDYSTNFMGPISMDWFRARDLTQMVDIEIKTPIEAKLYKANIGDTVQSEDITEYWCGGRIDIYGLDADEYYGGTSEYGLPIMDGESWNKLTEWLEEYVSETLTSFEDLITMFEKETKHKIRWAIYEFGDVE
jgi:hypothetical protein